MDNLVSKSTLSTVTIPSPLTVKWAILRTMKSGASPILVILKIVTSLIMNTPLLDEIPFKNVFYMKANL
jgi:hypothetical protein